MRRIRVPDELADYRYWSHLAQVCRVERIVHRKGGTRREWAYAVTSLEHQAGGRAPMRLIPNAPATPPRVSGRGTRTLERLSTPQGPSIGSLHKMQ